MLIVIVVNTTYLFFRYQILAESSVDGKFENGQYIITAIKPGSQVDKAGLQIGDILLSINSVAYTEDYDLDYNPKAGDTLTCLVARNNEELTIPIILVSYMTEIPGFFQVMYGLILLLSISSLYIFYKKPEDPAARIFFIYLQLFAMMQNARNLGFQDPFATFANIAFLFSGCLSVAALIHFHLLFPRPSKIYTRYKWLPFFFYGIGFFIAVPYSLSITVNNYYPSNEHLSNALLMNEFGLTWMTLAFCIAFGIAVYQFITIKNTLARNQTRIVIIGSMFGFITPMALVFLNDFIGSLVSEYPFFIDFSQGVGGLIMITCLLIAIFRYRIWGTEIFIRKALLYLSATFIITLSYLLLIFLVENLTSRETNMIRFLSLAVSVIVFMVLRDHIQHLIERLFHRESYDYAVVVSDFESKLAGTYQFDELKSGIARSLDDIFHFKSFAFNLKKNVLFYEPVYVLGVDNHAIDKEFEVSWELENLLRKSKVFSPEELEKKPSILDMTNGELIVPLLEGDQPCGFFLCGPKKSEKSYSLQDIRVLSLLAQRTVGLFHSASLYQKDLDRQLMLERERARISQDMHDDVGASLTRISILSDLAKNKDDITGETKQWLGQISDTSRGVMEEMSQIIWALNPKNDTLAGLVAYLRRFVNEYLEPTTIDCTFDLPETMPYQPLGVEVRRNVYLVVREALHNVVKHSGATKVVLSLKIEDYRFKIKIKDNGKGFDPGNLEFPGNGLVNMKKRMNDIGGEFLIHSGNGEGTEIELMVLTK